MKIDKSIINPEEFSVMERELFGEKVYLINPSREGVEWTQSNKFLRSVVIDEAGEVISSGMPKFVNYGENPIHFPPPQSLTNCEVVTKIDGSLLIVSKWDGKFILRTRGTVDASGLENGFELDIFKQKYPNVFSYKNELTTWDFSLLFEWTAGKKEQKIIIDYGHEPTWLLIGCIHHDTGALSTQKELDSIAQLFNCSRPEYHQFSSLVELISSVKNWNDKEGVCLYSGRGQAIHKLKSLWYLKLHRFKSNATLENTLELYFEWNMPNYTEFQAKLLEEFDWECYELVRGFVSLICDAKKEVDNILSGFNTFVDKIKLLPSRKEQAMVVMSSYGKETGRTGMIFTLLDGKQLDSDQLKKLFWQCLKK